MVADKIPKSKTHHRIFTIKAGRICLLWLTLLGKKEGLGIQPLAKVLLQGPARPPVLLLAVGVALLGVTHALRVGVARGVVVAAGLLEHVGHLSSFLFWTNLIIHLLVSCVNGFTVFTQIGPAANVRFLWRSAKLH